MADGRLSLILARLDAGRDEFQEALADVDADLVAVPGVVGDWSVRDLVVHVAAWASHATDALALAAGGRGAEFTYSTDDTDAINERVLAQARIVDPRDALTREETAFAAMRAAVAALDPDLLDLRLGNGDTVAEVIDYDGADHYAEHTGHLRAWFGADDEEPDAE